MQTVLHENKSSNHVQCWCSGVQYVINSITFICLVRIQKNVKMKIHYSLKISVLVFLSAVQAAVRQVNQAMSTQDEAALLAALRLEALGLLGVQETNCSWYLEHFTTYCQHKSKVY